MRFKRLCLSFLLCGLMVHIEDGDALASPVEPGPGLKVTTTREGLIVDWRVPSPQITLDADGSVSVVMPGYSLTDQPDAPRRRVCSGGNGGSISFRLDQAGRPRPRPRRPSGAGDVLPGSPLRLRCASDYALACLDRVQSPGPLIAHGEGG